MPTTPPVTGVTPLWVSSDHSVATVSTTGLATAVGAGVATITAAVRGVPGNATLSVAQTPTQLAFAVEPSNTTTDGAISPAIQVEIQDANGKVIPTARDAVTLSLGTNPTNADLTGSETVNAVGGIASFPGISLTQGGSGFTLTAASGSLTGATSGSFDVGVPTMFVGYSSGVAAVNTTTHEVMWTGGTAVGAHGLAVLPNQDFAYLADLTNQHGFRD